MCFNTHRPTPLPRPDADGRITIYRGMGTQSLRPDRRSLGAVTRKCTLVCQSFWAGDRIAVAHVKSEQIIAYFHGYSMEMRWLFCRVPYRTMGMKI